MPDSGTLDPQQGVILLIDLQEKLLPLIRSHDTLLSAAELLLRGGAIFKVPVLATEQYPAGIGHTVAPLSAVLKELDAKVFEKMSFSCWGDARFADHLQGRRHRQVVVAGIETHVCVQQTGLDLLARGYDVTVCADAVGSRTRIDHDTALERLRHAGAGVTTVESVLFEWCRQCGTNDFKRMIELIKQRGS